MARLGLRSGLLALLAATHCAASSAKSSQGGLTVPTDVYPDWTYAGCYTDNVAKRTLAVNSGLGQNLTNEKCVAYCAQHGYRYAGTEYSTECYCGQSLQNGGSLAAETGCQMACNGDTTQPCGGPDRLTLFEAPPDSGPVTNPGVNGYRSWGCYTDNVQNRTLSHNVGVPGGTNNMTVAACISACQSQDFTFAGLEYSYECFCGNAILNNAMPDQDGGANCDMTCSGNSKELCGGADRLNLYGTAIYSSVTSASPSSTTASEMPSTMGSALPSYSMGSLMPSSSIRLGVSSSSSSSMESALSPSSMRSPPSSSTRLGVPSSSVEYSSSMQSTLPSSSRGSMLPPLSSQTTPSSIYTPPISASSARSTAVSTHSRVVSMSATPATSTTVSSESVSSSTAVISSTTIASTTTSSATGVPTEWSYKGCWVDNANGRIMGHQQPDDQNLTVQSCIETCLGQGYSVAGLQYSYQCFCDDYLKNGATLGNDADCNTRCAGDSSQLCGGPNRDSVWSTEANLTVYPVPTAQREDLPGSWKYAGCLKDSTPGMHILPYQIILNDNNTATNCLEQCSRFKYDAAGMEYGDECYCGTAEDIAAANTTFSSESDCSFECSGDPIHLCGGPLRLSYYTWDGPPLAEFKYPSGNDAGKYQFLIGGVVIPLITQAARNGKVTFLEKWGTGPPNTTGTYELDLARIDNFVAAWRPLHVKTDIFCSASITLPDKAGRQLNVGGWALDSTFGIRLYWPDGSPGVWGRNDWQEDVQAVSLQNGRWYPSAMIMANGSVLVMGGEVGSNGAPTPTLEILPPVGPVLYCDWLNRTDPNNLYPFPVVLPHGDVFVAYYNEAIILDEKTLEVKKQLPNIPGAVNNFLAGRTYPLEGTAVLLPQYPPYDDLEILICGGSAPPQNVALDNCALINPEKPDADWEIERMPSKRVMTCMTALPDGTFLILNGAEQGVAGFGLGNDPNHNAVLYDPTAPIGSRMSIMANTTIDRLYHSEAILLDDGRVLVTGSDPEDDVHEQEYRVEVFLPPYLLKNITQPKLQINNADWSYGQTVRVSASKQITKVSLLGGGSSTHGNSMGQRTIFPKVSCSGRTCSVVAPPNAHVCPPGWFQVFGLTPEGVPSLAVWVRIGGDPAKLGNWPNATAFTVPGV